MDAKRLNMMLNVQALAIFVLAIMLVVLGEIGKIPNGLFGPDYWTQTGMYIGLLVAVPLALKLMNFKFVQSRVHKNLQRYLLYAQFRLFLLTVPMVMGFLFYYLMNEVSMLYCALISALAFLYIWPSMGRQLRETGSEEDGEE